MNEFRKAVIDDLPQLKEIWKICFGDDEKYIDLFFKTRFQTDKAFVMTNSDNVVSSMLFTLPFSLKIMNKLYPASYLYACATHPDFQRQGLLTQLLRNVEDILLAQQVKLMALFPASNDIVHFYQKLEFKTSFGFDILDFKFSSLSEIDGTVTNVSTAEYLKIRKNIFSNLPIFAIWDEAAIAFQENFSKLDNGGLYLIEQEGYKAVALTEIYKNILYIKELAIPPQWVNQAVQLLCNKMNTLQCVLRLPIGWTYDTKALKKPFGMSKWLGNKNLEFEDGYLGMTLD